MNTNDNEITSFIYSRFRLTVIRSADIMNELALAQNSY